MPAKSAYFGARRYPQPKTSRRRPRRWPWLALPILLAAAVYFSLPRQKAATALPPRIGIIAGHWQYDPGATCPDGLREIDITVPVAREVVYILTQRGYEVEMLPEYPDNLAGYRAVAFVSLHVDSCIPELSGFKIAGRPEGPAAIESARLVDCLTRAYAAATGLEFHENTITPAMTEYHAFHRLDPSTPAAIVELGFMGGDRELLTAHQDQVAQGIAEGIASFLSSQDESQTPTAQP